MEAMNAARNAELMKRNLTEISLEKALNLSRDRSELSNLLMDMGPGQRARVEAAVGEALRAHDGETNALSQRLLPELNRRVREALQEREDE